MAVLYIVHVYYNLAYIQHNGVVSLEKQSQPLVPILSQISPIHASSIDI